MSQLHKFFGNFIEQKPIDSSKETILQLSDEIYGHFRVTFPKAMLPYTTDEELVVFVLSQLKYVLMQYNFISLLDKVKEKSWHIHERNQGNSEGNRENQAIIYICSHSK